MDHVEEDDADCENDDEKSETIKFNAETHLAFFLDNFAFLVITSINSVSVSSAITSTQTKKIVSDSNLLMIGCYSHKRNLEVNEMIADVPYMHWNVQKVHMMMTIAKKSEEQENVT